MERLQHPLAQHHGRTQGQPTLAYRPQAGGDGIQALDHAMIERQELLAVDRIPSGEMRQLVTDHRRDLGTVEHGERTRREVKYPPMQHIPARDRLHIGRSDEEALRQADQDMIRHLRPDLPGDAGDKIPQAGSDFRRDRASQHRTRLRRQPGQGLAQVEQRPGRDP